LQGHEKIGSVAVAREVKLLDAAVSHEHTIRVILSAGSFGEKRAGVGGGVGQELKAHFTIGARRNRRILNQNHGD